MAEHKILLDAPTNRPALGYEGIAAAFAGIITDSQPNFAIGIFGGWGSGKTTLMGAIKAALPTDDILTVEFNAWRFEREPQLLVPLLDTIRGALASRAALEDLGIALGSNPPDVAPTLRRIAGQVGRIVKALATGLSGSAGIPGAVTVNYDAGAAIAALDALAAPRSAPDPNPGQDDIAPKSLYVAAFSELRAAFEDLGSIGLSRIVVFVDDLDRCLPANALDVLESMKLFFDLLGFIFVVGLDESVIDRAIATKLVFTESRPQGVTSVAAPALNGQLGREYAKKIFQVPYTLPVMLPVQLNDLLESMYAEAGITGDQLTDLRTRVLPYLEVIAVQRRVNPREVKRFINSYTLQTLIRPDLAPNAILALQTIAFRPDWEYWYEAVSARPGGFLNAVRKYRQAKDRTENDKSPVLSGSAIEDLFKNELQRDLPFSDDLLKFFASDLIRPLVSQRDLDPYLSSLQSARAPETSRVPGGDLSRLLVSDLQRLAEELGISGAGRMRKGDLVAAITERTGGVRRPSS
jgi:KAP family P-loop domain/Rho termination factor, N-terminal domain